MSEIPLPAPPSSEARHPHLKQNLYAQDSARRSKNFLLAKESPNEPLADPSLPDYARHVSTTAGVTRLGSTYLGGL